MLYTKVFNEKQRSPAIVCHPTIPPYLRERDFTNVYLECLAKKENIDVNMTEGLCCFGVKYRIVFKFADEKIHKGKKKEWQ